MIYAQIKDGVIRNTAVVLDEDVLSLISEGYDEVVRIDEIDPQPGIGWSYDGNDFTAPPPEPPADECENCD